MKIALLAGTQSGCGKTTITSALLQYLKRQNQNVVSFKAGPDFLDPLWHQLITEQVSHNIDTRMVGLDESKRLVNRQSKLADYALIEGVMGLFDGRSGVGQEGSSADLAKGLSCPVILVINAKGISGSIVPMVSGYCDYANKMGVIISAVIANRVGSPHHAKLLQDFLQEYNLPPLIAWMEKDAPKLAERHLGLVAPAKAEIPDFTSVFHVNEALLKTAFSSWDEILPIEDDLGLNNTINLLVGKKIAIAKDEACCFIYQANIDWLIEQGAKIQYFSVLKGDAIPSDADALWLPGGYPELYLQQLSVSKSWESLNQFIKDDKPVLAECGGSQLLGEKLIDKDGKAWNMAGVLAYETIMQTKLASLGYREERCGIRGHEFHYSTREGSNDFQPCFDCARGDKGIRYRNLRLSYIHWYFASAPVIAAGWFTNV